MTSIAILGNSHTAALKLAWAKMQDSITNVELTFFAQGQDGMRDLILRNERLVPRNEKLRRAIAHTSGGRDSISPDEYDAIMLYGLGLQAYRPPAGFFSQAALSRAAVDHVHCTLSWSLLSMLRRISNLPIFVGPAPLRAFPPRAEATAPEELYAAGMQMIEAAFQDFDATFLPQPPETITAGFYTKREFSIGSRALFSHGGRPAQVHAEVEDRHMNEQYGAIFLNTYLPMMADMRRAA